jgi:hypothetical protein
MTISDTTISQDVFNSIRAKVVAAAPYVYNATTTTTVAASIVASYNDKTPSRPQIVINPALIDENEWKFGSSQGKKVINVVIECYYNNTLGIDQLFDSVRAALVANDIDGMDLMAISSDYGVATNPADAKYQLKSGTFTYERE